MGSDRWGIDGIHQLSAHNIAAKTFTLVIGIETHLAMCEPVDKTESIHEYITTFYTELS